MDKGLYSRQLKTVVRECWSVERKQMEKEPRMEYLTDSMDEIRRMLMLKVTKYIMMGNNVKEDTKIYISNFYMTYNSVASELKRKGEETSKNTVMTRVHRDLHKLQKIFSIEFMADLLVNLDRPMYIHEIALDNAERDTMGTSAYELENRMNIGVLRVPIGQESSTAVSDSDLNEFFNKIKPYTKRSIEAIENSLDRNVCGYVRRLLKDGGRNDYECEHLRKINLVLGIFMGNK